jgi:hypothetical protein
LFWAKFKKWVLWEETPYNVVNNVGEVAYIFGIPRLYFCHALVSRNILIANGRFH